MRRVHLALISLAALAGVVGCASEKAVPVPLQPVTAQIAGKQVWALRGGDIGFPLSVAVRDGSVYAAADNGTVLAVEAQTGREVWRADVKAKISAGVGSDGRFASVVTRDSDLVTLENGVERWRVRLDARVVTAPLVAGERVFVVGVDRVVHAFDALDGRRLWTLKRPGDALTLAQPAVLTAYKDTLLVGQGGRLLGVDPTTATVRWEAVISTPRGTNEVERLADLVGPAARVGASFCVRAFQNAVGCVDAARGALQWSSNGGGTQAVGADADYVFGADANDRINARKRGAGELAWSTERYLNRRLSAPVSMDKTVVFGDYQGYLHFLARDNGAELLRLPTDGSPIAAAPVMVGTTLVVATRDGGLFAFRPE